MKKRPRKYHVNVREAKELLEYLGFIVREMNWYQLRLKHRESQCMWDWYHTQGSTVMTKDGIPRRWGTYGNFEQLGKAIKSYIYN